MSITEKSCCELSECSDRSTARAIKLKTELTTRLNRVEGQVRGIKGMIGQLLR